MDDTGTGETAYEHAGAHMSSAAVVRFPNTWERVVLELEEVLLPEVQEEGGRAACMTLLKLLTFPYILYILNPQCAFLHILSSIHLG